MRKICSWFLIGFFVLGIILVIPQNAYAKQGKEKEQKAHSEIIKKLDQDFVELLQKKSITRAQAALLFAEEEQDFGDFQKMESILARVTDRNAIELRYQKAVAFVIDKGLMDYKVLPNGKIVFQPNKKISLTELMGLFDLNIEIPFKREHIFTGDVRFIYMIGSNTWVTVETEAGILRTAYFTPTNRPANLSVNMRLQLTVEDYRIKESKIIDPENVLSNLIFSLKPRESNPKVGEQVLLIPLLANSSNEQIMLENTSYRFTIKKIGTNQEWEFISSASQDLTVPAKNQPIQLAVPSAYWYPPSAGDYQLVKVQLKVENGVWQDISYVQSLSKRNYLTTNQSSVEMNTVGFSPYGHDTYAGAILSRTTSEKWQGEASLQVTTNGYNPWQGVHLPHQGAISKGDLTFSFYIKAPVGTSLRVKVYDPVNNTYPSGGHLEFTASGSWQRKSVSFNVGQNTTQLALQVTLNNNTAVTAFYLDGLQLEAGDSPTWWVSGSDEKAVVTVVQ